MASRPDVRAVQMGGNSPLCMDSTSALHPIVPVHLRQAIFTAVHCQHALCVARLCS